MVTMYTFAGSIRMPCGIFGNQQPFSHMSTYGLSGTGATLAGIILTSYLGTAKANFGKELTLPIITAVVLGGTSTLGGEGNNFWNRADDPGD